MPFFGVNWHFNSNSPNFTHKIMANVNILNNLCRFFFLNHNKSDHILESVRHCNNLKSVSRLQKDMDMNYRNLFANQIKQDYLLGLIHNDNFEYLMRSTNYNIEMVQTKADITKSTHQNFYNKDPEILEFNREEYFKYQVDEIKQILNAENGKVYLTK